MNISLIEMEPEAADVKLKAYKKALGRMKGKKVAEEVQTQYEQAIAGYKALKKGTPLIDLEDVFQRVPFDEKGRPKIAIGRADRKIIEFRWENSKSIRFQPQGISSNWPVDTIQLTLSFRPETAISKTDLTTGYKYTYDGYAQVPLVPADVRPERGVLKDWFILWEVEKWVDNRNQIMPDKDPYLLKHIGGTLYAVIAEWDLTSLEKAIMRGIQR